MKLTEKLGQIWKDSDDPFLVHRDDALRFADLSSQTPIDLSLVKQGDVVAIIGDFDPGSILTLLHLVDLGAIIVPLTRETERDHDYFFDAAQVDVVIEEGKVSRRKHSSSHESIEYLRRTERAGLVLFSTGTTGRPKAILHDLTLFLKRFETPRPTLRTINFLLFDHIGGINTLFHTLFNRGVVVVPEERTVEGILDTCRAHDVEALPTTPTFLRMMLMSGAIPERVPDSIRIITYGTERMDQPTLDALCSLLPDVDFRQTFGMSELGIVRVKSASRDSLFMRVGGEGVETRVVDGVLQIRSQTRMLGYLNAPSPFDAEGWYNTQDIVEEKDGCYKVVGRTGDVINVGGLKFMASEVEVAALEFPGVELAKAVARENPITGHHVELIAQPVNGRSIDSAEMMVYMKSKLPRHMAPRRIRVEPIQVGHRFKKA